MEALMISGNTKATREALFIALYQKAFPAAAKYVNKMGGNFDEAKDIFQDALVIYYEKAVSNQIPIHVNEKAYLLGITKNLWLQKYREDRQNVPFDSIDTEAAVEDANEPATEKLMHYLETAGQKCMDILKAFYYDNLPVNKLADLFGYTSTHSATVQKYKCLEKVRDTVKQKSLTYEDFLK